MKTQKLTIHIVAIPLLAVWSLAGFARADTPYVTGLYWIEGSAYRYAFTIQNPSPYGVALMYIRHIPATDMWDITDPPGWHHNATEHRVIGWGVDGPDYYVLPGESLAGFDFTSPAPLGTVNWWIGSSYSFTGLVTPEFVPEPATLTVLASLSLLTGGMLVRKQCVRRQKR